MIARRTAVIASIAAILIWSIAAGVCTMSSAASASETVPGGAGGTQEIFVCARPSAPLGDIDLDVTFINRAPLYRAYCVQYRYDAPETPGRPYLCPGSENDRRWPEPGELVTFTAHIVNKGTAASPAFGYAWRIDGAEVARGMLPALAPAAEVDDNLPVAVGPRAVGR